MGNPLTRKHLRKLQKNTAEIVDTVADVTPVVKEPEKVPEILKEDDSLLKRTQKKKAVQSDLDVV